MLKCNLPNEEIDSYFHFLIAPSLPTLLQSRMKFLLIDACASGILINIVEHELIHLYLLLDLTFLKMYTVLLFLVAGYPD